MHNECVSMYQNSTVTRRQYACVHSIYVRATTSVCELRSQHSTLTRSFTKPLSHAPGHTLQRRGSGMYDGATTTYAVCCIPTEYYRRVDGDFGYKHMQAVAKMKNKSISKWWKRGRALPPSLPLLKRVHEHTARRTRRCHHTDEQPKRPKMNTGREVRSGKIMEKRRKKKERRRRGRDKGGEEGERSVHGSTTTIAHSRQYSSSTHHDGACLWATVFH